MPPEVDDSLTYVLKTKQMEECFFQDCPALEDLRQQLLPLSSQSQAGWQKHLAASRIFPVYHPLLSLGFLGLKNLFGLDLMTTYKVVWTVFPLLFGLAFGYFLAKLWGMPAAGAALILLAFKVFPDTGLHYVVPSNICMALATAIWARIVSRKGDAPWALSIGSIGLIGLHPIGRLYALIAALLLLWLTGVKKRARILVPVVLTLVMIAAAFVISTMIDRPRLSNLALLPPGDYPVIRILSGALESLVEVAANISRLAPGLFGSPSVFFFSVVLGFLTVNKDRRDQAAKTLGINLFFLMALFFYVSSHPADVIFRMWIPIVVLLFGAVGQALVFLLYRSWNLLVDHFRHPKDISGPELSPAVWPVLALAVLVGYSVNMMSLGAHQIAATIEHVRDRQPLKFDPKQPQKLLATAKPGDRVLYSSMIIMPWYFIQGAMELGAVYYHPQLTRLESDSKWFERPDIRFAVTYNPTVYHPSFEGEDENRWWITSPEYIHSPLSKRRKNGPLSREGVIPATLYRWIEITPQTVDHPDTLTIRVKNPGSASYLEMVPVDSGERLLTSEVQIREIPSRWSGDLVFHLEKLSRSGRYRILLPNGSSCRYEIQRIFFGSSSLNWPWEVKAGMSFMPKADAATPITVRFDPRTILPKPLNQYPIEVLNDSGSSVLFRIDRPSEGS